MARIGVFGAGYVGLVSAVCLARDGHDVTVVDIDGAKIDLINSGVSPIAEPGVEDLLKLALSRGSLRATTGAIGSVMDSEISLICVGTPGEADGSIDTRPVRTCCESIGEALRNKKGPHTVALRSTVTPGTTRRLAVPTLELNSGRRVGVDLTVVANPEFLREGSAISDYYNPAKTVIGETFDGDGAHLVALYSDLPGDRFICRSEVAELAKYADNYWHALKVSFANEISAIGNVYGIDNNDLSRIFLSDRRLNISDAYLHPGFAFGGSCLPKDLDALRNDAMRIGVKIPLLEGVVESNLAHIERAVDLIRRTQASRVGLWGVAFKPGTDDLRGSAFLRLARMLQDSGIEVLLYDSKIPPDSISDFLNDLGWHDLGNSVATNFTELVDCSSTVVIGNVSQTDIGLNLKTIRTKKLIDLCNIPALRSLPNCQRIV